MKEIKLTQGLVALVDDIDFERVNQFRWSADWNKTAKCFYAKRLEYPRIRMHRFIMNVEDSKVVVDHRFHNTLDNQRDNLRVCSVAQNIANSRKASGCSSVYKGVSLHKLSLKWMAYIVFKRKRHYLGLFASEVDAAIAYNNAALNYFGEFAMLNTIQHPEYLICCHPAQ